jgi:DNA-binding NarL/FixJ family response regulator
MATSPPAAERLKVLVADDHEVIRVGVSTFLRSKLNCQPCLEAENGRVAIELAKANRPHVVVADVVLPGLNGIEMIQQIKQVSPESEVVVLTGADSENLIKPAFAVGAKAFLLKVEAVDYLVEAVLNLAAHRFFITPYVQQALHGNSPEALLAPGGAKLLTPRQREILQLLAEGKTNRQVASSLGLKMKTVEAHRGVIMRKLRFKSFSDLVRYAIRNQMIAA